MLLISDLDGTLFKAKPVVRLASEQLLAEMGYGAPSRDALVVKAEHGAGETRRDIAGDSEARLRERYIELLCAAVMESGEAYPCIVEAVKGLYDRGVDIAVCSRSSERYINTVLKHIGIASYVKQISSVEGCATKTEAVKALMKLGVPAVVVGDTHGDIEAAHTNGLPAIAALYGYGNKDMLADAEQFAHSPADIAGCVQWCEANFHAPPHVKTVNEI